MFPVPLYVAWMEYVPAASPAGTVNEAVAVPPVTVPLVAAVPTCVAPLYTRKVTVPSPTAPAGLPTVAVRVTDCPATANAVEADATTNVEVTVETVRFPVATADAP